MTLRLFAASLGIVVVMGLTAIAPAQEKKAPAKGQGDGPAADAPKDGAPKADATKTDAPKADAKKGGTELATFGGGCFWCMEAVFERVPGVKSVVSGYTGGTVPNPTYEMVHTGETGHAEVIQIAFDPAVVTYDKLLSIFWASHDPTQLNRQGVDVGTQYRSVIFYHSEDQKLAAQKSFKELKARQPRLHIVTRLDPMKEFYPAEMYHQDYYRNNPNAGYSVMHIAPLVRKMQSKIK